MNAKILQHTPKAMGYFLGDQNHTNISSFRKLLKQRCYVAPLRGMKVMDSC